MPDSSTCIALTCGETMEGTVETCPKCGAKMRTSRSIRQSGWALLLIGTFLTGLMGTITVKLLPSLLPVNGALGTDRFTGTPDQADLILQLFMLVIGFGVAAILNGAWQIATGRRNRLVLLATLALAAMIVFAAYSTVQAIKT